jgi:hypothetical protein
MHDVQLADWIGTLRQALKDAAKTANGGLPKTNGICLNISNM